jgi:hypothetical protein
MPPMTTARHGHHLHCAPHDTVLFSVIRPISLTVRITGPHGERRAVTKRAGPGDDGEGIGRGVRSPAAGPYTMTATSPRGYLFVVWVFGPRLDHARCRGWLYRYPSGPGPQSPTLVPVTAAGGSQLAFSAMDVGPPLLLGLLLTGLGPPMIAGSGPRRSRRRQLVPVIPPKSSS